MTIEHRQRKSGALIFVPDAMDKIETENIKKEKENRKKLEKELKEVSEFKKKLEQLIKENEK